MTSPRSGPIARPSVHLSIDVPNLEAGLRFYVNVFGFREKARPFPTMAILDANNVSVCMHEKQGGSKSSSAGSERRRYERHWTPVHLDLHVEDFDGVLNKVRAQGGAIENEYRTQGPRRLPQRLLLQRSVCRTSHRELRPARIPDRRLRTIALGRSR